MLRVLSCVLLVTLAASASVDDVIPEQAAVSLEASHRAHDDALATIQFLQSQGKAENQCADVAKTVLEEVSNGVGVDQGLANALTDGSECLNLGQADVALAQTAVDTANQEMLNAGTALTTAKNEEVTFPPFKYSTLVEGQCGDFFASAPYQAQVAKVSQAQTRANASGPAKDAAQTVLDNVVKEAKRLKNECLCAAKKANDSLKKGVEGKIADNQKAWTKAQHMLCVLDHKSTEQCEVPPLPAVTFKNLVSEAASAEGCDDNNNNGPPVQKKIDCLLQMQADLTSFLITDKLPTGTNPIPWPGTKLVIAYRQGSKAHNSHLTSWTKGFSDTSRYQTVKINSADQIPEAASTFWDFIPNNAYTASDKSAIAAFLERGGRAIIIGEHHGYAAAANGYINTLSNYLGGSITIQPKTVSPNFLTAANSEIANLKGVHGVNKFQTAAYAPLTVDKDKTDVFMSDQPTGDIFAADQYLKKGRLTVWADINPQAYDVNTPFFQNMVHEAMQFVEEVKRGIDPNAARKCD